MIIEFFSPYFLIDGNSFVEKPKKVIFDSLINLLITNVYNKLIPDGVIIDCVLFNILDPVDDRTGQNGLISLEKSTKSIDKPIAY